MASRPFSASIRPSRSTCRLAVKTLGPVAATLHPQIVMIQADSLPFGGQWHGREGFERWMQAFGEAWSSASATDLRFFEHDDTVVVVAQMEVTARASGQSFRAPICHVVRIRDGLLMEFQMFLWDMVATNRASAPSALREGDAGRPG